MTISLTCQHCGAPFEAKRSDAKFHNAACRQAHFRKRQDPGGEVQGTGHGSRRRTSPERLDRFFSRTLGTKSVMWVQNVLRWIDVSAAVEHATDEQLERWEGLLTAGIQSYGKVRRAVRAEQSSRRGT